MSLDEKLIVDEIVKEHGTISAKGNIQNMPKKWFGKWPTKCETCYYDEGIMLGDYPFFVDGRTVQGYWALMCPQCHRQYGVGLGTDRGQKYDSKTLEKLEG
jgi:hypothetical protein